MSFVRNGKITKLTAVRVSTSRRSWETAIDFVFFFVKTHHNYSDTFLWLIFDFGIQGSFFYQFQYIFFLCILTVNRYRTKSATQPRSLSYWCPSSCRMVKVWRRNCRSNGNSKSKRRIKEIAMRTPPKKRQLLPGSRSTLLWRFYR